MLEKSVLEQCWRSVWQRSVGEACCRGVWRSFLGESVVEKPRGREVFENGNFDKKCWRNVL